MPYRTVSRLAVAAVAFVCCWPSLIGQSAPIAIRDKAMHLDVVITPKNGDPVAGLQQQDLALFDNKTQLEITSFQEHTSASAPVEVILLIDAVNANYTTVAYERTQIDRFLKANDGHLTLPTTLAVLNDKGAQIEPTFTKDGNVLSRSLDDYTVGLRTIRRSAGIYGAEDRMDLSIHALSQLLAVEAPRPGRKLILWISPGWPYLSGPSIQLSKKQEEQIFASIVDLSTRMREARVTLYSINPLGAGENIGRTLYYEDFLKGVIQPNKANLGDLSLQVLALQSGGQAFNSSNDISGLLTKSISDTKSYYTVNFDPAPSDKGSEYHHLEIKVSKPGLIARTRDGYYSQP